MRPAPFLAGVRSARVWLVLARLGRRDSRRRWIGARTSFRRAGSPRRFFAYGPSCRRQGRSCRETITAATRETRPGNRTPPSLSTPHSVTSSQWRRSMASVLIRAHVATVSKLVSLFDWADVIGRFGLAL